MEERQTGWLVGLWKNERVMAGIKRRGEKEEEAGEMPERTQRSDSNYKKRVQRGQRRRQPEREEQ